MTLKRFGFFDELPEPDAVVQLTASITDPPLEDEEGILSYLNGGKQILAVPGLVLDLLSDDEEIIGPPHVFTDGEWAWTSDVTHYIERYHISIPSQLLARMRANNFQCPEVAETEEIVRSHWQT